MQIGLRALQGLFDDKVTQFEDPGVRTLNNSGQRDKGVCDSQMIQVHKKNGRADLKFSTGFRIAKLADSVVPCNLSGPRASDSETHFLVRE